MVQFDLPITLRIRGQDISAVHGVSGVALSADDRIEILFDCAFVVGAQTVFGIDQLVHPGDGVRGLRPGGPGYSVARENERVRRRIGLIGVDLVVDEIQVLAFGFEVIVDAVCVASGEYRGLDSLLERQQDSLVGFLLVELVAS
ncbi:MAG: hypothetical protein L0G87_02245 [Renibacterium salmoninarum]|nr:hypothetical protein [Renibacterium salmoninarum]